MATKEKTKKPTARREAADETTSSERLTALVEESDALARIVAKNPSAPVRVRTHYSHQMTAAARAIAAMKFLMLRSKRVAIRRQSLRRQNMRSMMLRCL